MKENTTTQTTTTAAQRKPGFFKRIVAKVDGAMKAKAEEKSKQDSCCSGSDKGGKCC